jgi:hypothetical protein
VGAKLGSIGNALAGANTSGTSAARILVGDSPDRIVGVVDGTADKVVLEKEISSNTGMLDGYNEGLIVGVQVIFSEPLPSAFLLYITVPTVTEAVVTKAATAMAAIVSWVAIDIPTVPAAADAIVPAPAAVDVPADAAAWTAID